MGNSYHYFCHISKTRKEFEDDCERLVKISARKIIDEEDYTISGIDIVDQLAELLEAEGYKRIRFAEVDYGCESLKSQESSEAWRKAIGEKLYQEAVYKSFDNAIAYRADSVFVITGESERLYHKSDCPVLLAARGREIWAFTEDGFKDGHMQDYSLCDQCKERNVAEVA